MHLDDKAFIEILKELNKLERVGTGENQPMPIKGISASYGLLIKKYLTNYDVLFTDYGLMINKKQEAMK